MPITNNKYLHPAHNNKYNQAGRRLVTPGGHSVLAIRDTILSFQQLYKMQIKMFNSAQKHRSIITAWAGLWEKCNRIPANLDEVFLDFTENALYSIVPYIEQIRPDSGAWDNWFAECPLSLSRVSGCSAPALTLSGPRSLFRPAPRQQSHLLAFCKVAKIRKLFNFMDGLVSRYLLFLFSFYPLLTLT